MSISTCLKHEIYAFTFVYSSYWINFVSSFLPFIWLKADQNVCFGRHYFIWIVLKFYSIFVFLFDYGVQIKNKINICGLNNPKMKWIWKDNILHIIKGNPSIATLGLTWNFSSAENLESLSLQVRPQSGTIITRPASQPLSQPASHLHWKWHNAEYLSNYLLDCIQILNLS
jgi:hypothetical protein